MEVVDGKNPQKLMNRFKWINNSQFMIVSKEGMERLINIDKNYIEESYNYRPLFNEISGTEWKKWPYYLKREDLNKNTLARLKRIYQKYKSEYFLLGTRDTTIFN